MAAVQTRDDKVREDAVDKRLIAAYTRGNSHALSELYRRHSRRVESVARHVVGPIDEVEDIVQDVFIELQRALHKFRGESRFTTWLHRVTVNVSLQHLRKKKRKGWARWTSLDQVPRHAPRSRSLERQTEARETVRVLYEVLETLTEKKRVVFSLYELEGLSLEEISQAVGTSVNTVKSRLFHARREIFSEVKRRGAMPTHTLQVIK
ncbi:MAG: RNA polymerase sigma factor [Myxococcales bacterium]|nr:RNA polymerase sigma factor [Myxococcales bacterium]